MKKMIFLKNPPKHRRGLARSSARSRGAAVPRRKRRPVPAGFASWSAYMASIRPGAKRTAAVRRGGTMAGKKRRSHSGRHTRKGGHHRRYRHNPPAFRLGNVVAFGKDAVIGAGEVLAGKIIARKTRGMLGQKPGTVLGSVIEATVGIIAGLGVQRINAKAGALVAIGGVLSPMETLVQQLGIPHVSDSLADDGFLFGGDSGVEMVSAVPDRGTDQVSDFVEGGGRANVTLGDFVAGAQAAA